MDFERSQTYENLKKAFQGETGASGKYAIYARKAWEDGYQQIGNIFESTSGNEREHAEIWLKAMNGGEVPSTLDNLKEAASGESYEWHEMYREFAETEGGRGIRASPICSKV
jgi:rubrerythrin